ncbi:MAG: amidohydrolase family protein, partial [Deltaproteobacteria bacterium]|nr:amidohydrolase family protein [Deltaproteobacteria bacterium]
PDPAVTLQTAHHARLTLEAGITTVRDVGSKNFIDIHVRDAVKTGLIPGPEIFCAGQMICITGGHGHPLGCVADGPDEVRRAARKQVAAGVDWVKFMATGGVLSKGGKPGIPQLTLDELRAGIEEAHKLGPKTCAHSQGLEGTRNAVFAGIDSIEHGVSLDDEIIEEMVKRGVFLVPTFSAPANILTKGTEFGIPAEFVVKTKRLAEAHAAGVARAREAGVKIVMGTDAGTPFNYHGENASELVHLVEYGFSPHEAIICSTSRAAQLLGVEDTLGAILPGLRADLLIVKGNPLEDISMLADKERIWAVYQNGRVVKGLGEAFCGG